MPVSEFVSVGDGRNTIVVIGPSASAVPLALPEYAFSHPSREDRSWIESPQLEAVLLVQSPTNDDIAADLATFAGPLLQRGCPVFVAPVVQQKASDVEFRERIVSALEREKLPSSVRLSNQVAEWADDPDLPTLTPCVHVLQTHDWANELAFVVRSNRRGPRANHALALEVIDKTGRSTTLNEEQVLLVRRAFHDCHKVHLREVSNGISGVRAFRVHSWSSDRQVGSNWPTRLFMKLGKRTKVSREFRAFTHLAMDSVPYHLGPRIVRARSELGHTEGVLVSDYVSGAETLKDVCRDGRGAAAIAHLFDVTLESWRMNATRDERRLKRELRERQSAYDVPAHRRARVEQHISIAKVHAKMAAALGADELEPVLVGVVHGDLHATNVMVRGGDSIVIDLEKLRTGLPLLLDVANIEAGLFIDGFIGDLRPAPVVFESIRSLYSRTTLGHEFARWDAHDPSAWYFQCVRQIRMHARQMEGRLHQYSLVLACAFAKKACNSEDFDGPTTPASAGLASPAPEGLTSPGPTGLTKEDVRALSMRVAFEILSEVAAAS